MNASHAHKIDSQNNNVFWRDAINQEIHNNGVVFEMLEVTRQVLPDSTI